MSLVSNQAIADGRAILDSWPALQVEEQIEYEGMLADGIVRSKVRCFAGRLAELKGTDDSVVGAIQKYRLESWHGSSSESLEEAADHLKTFVDNLPLYFCSEATKNRGFEFVPKFRDCDEDKTVTQELPEVLSDLNEGRFSSVVFDVQLNGFHYTAPIPKWIAAANTACFPMSAWVIVDKQLNRSLEPGDENFVATENYCYSFLKKKCGPWFLGFGPGKFESAIKHYSFSLLADGDLEVQLTFIANPRSKRVLDLFGFDPIYHPVEAIDWLTGKRLNLFRRLQTKMEMIMMKQHVSVHERMLVDLLCRLRHPC